MNRALSWINFSGVLILTAVCVMQWRVNRFLHLEVAGLTKLRFEQISRIGELEKSLKGLTADLDLFRGQIIRGNEISKGTEIKLAEKHREVRQLSAERDQLKASMTNWAAAVAARDARLNEISEQLQKLAAARSESVAQFNELAAKYNKVVNDLNARTENYNELVEKYDLLTKSLKSSPQK